MVMCLKSVLAILILVVALPKFEAWATGQWYCHRLVPLSITSVVTPCSFPCLLMSSNHGHHGIILQKEADGTPCKVSGSPITAYQESQCTNGVCQLPHLQLHLKRAKRETTHTRKRRGANVGDKAEKNNEKEDKAQKNGKKKRRSRRRHRKRKRGKNNINDGEHTHAN
uniref:Basic tail secreted protein n=1 Tax=Rhipicephalus appendiculatus TaxID=34631 RepID=A0A131YMN1_RHIAP